MTEEENFRASGITYDIIPVQDRDTLELGGRKLEIFHISGHTPGSIAIYDHSTGGAGFFGGRDPGGNPFCRTVL